MPATNPLRKGRRVIESQPRGGLAARIGAFRWLRSDLGRAWPRIGETLAVVPGVSDCNPLRRFLVVGALKGEMDGLQNAIPGRFLRGLGYIGRQSLDFGKVNLLRFYNHDIAGIAARRLQL